MYDGGIGGWLVPHAGLQSWDYGSDAEVENVDDGGANNQLAAVPRVSKTKKRGRGNWTREDDELLQKAVAKFDARRWKEIAKHAFGHTFPQRTAVQCRQRWKSVLDGSLVKGRWTKEEDERLVELVGRIGSRKIKWAVIAKDMPGRLGKQCRERWYSYLAPDVVTDPYTEEEEATILRLHKIFGTAWSKMREHLPGRTDNSIKNQYHIIINRTRALTTRQEKSSEKTHEPKWTIEEEVTFIRGYKVFDTQWEEIAKLLPGRSAAAVQTHFTNSIKKIITAPEDEEPISRRRELLRQEYMKPTTDFDLFKRPHDWVEDTTVAPQCTQNSVQSASPPSPLSVWWQGLDPEDRKSVV